MQKKMRMQPKRPLHVGEADVCDCAADVCGYSADVCATVVSMCVATVPLCVTAVPGVYTLAQELGFKNQ